jgi:hypothetical protein
MELSTAEALSTEKAHIAAEALKLGVELGVEHFYVPCLAALAKTSKCWRARVRAAIDAAGPIAAQQLLLQTAGDESYPEPPVVVLKTLLERASSTADGAAKECFMTALVTKLVSNPGITWSAAYDWLLSGLQLTDTAICAAARIPSSQPALWARVHKDMLHTRIGGPPLSTILHALCDGSRAKVRFAW